jgi:thimet oligopeptidase
MPIPSHPGRVLRFVLALLAAAALPSVPALAAQQPGASAELHAWEGGDDPAALDAWVHGHLRRADAAIARLTAVKGAHTVANTLRPYDDAVNELDLATYQASVLYGVGATKELRDKAQALTETANAAVTSLSLNPAVYQALAAVPAPADAATRHYLEHTLLEYRLAGVDRDPATRAKIQALQEKITTEGLAFERTVHDDVRTVIADRADLAGLPPDYLAAHPADAEGHVTITSDPPDVRPVRRFAKSAELRRKAYLAYTQKGYPANTAILRELLEKRAELAQLLGYPTWADLAMADQMMGSPAKLAEFLKKIDAASREGSEREYAALLALAREQDPSIAKLSAADQSYWTEQYRRAKFDFDSQSVRPYFPYTEVERGVVGTASRLFRVEIRPVTGVRTWHPSVTVYDVYDGGQRIGRMYMDMHPRPGKDKWFSTQALTPGIGGRELPEATLVCNFPGGTAGDPGLMLYDDVVVFLHEFGHMMHHIIGSQNAFAGAGGFNVEGDFVEAPSQMLEEFFHDYGVLTSFARHYQTGAVLPRELFDRMIRSDAFGRAGGEQYQLIFSAVSLDFHTLPPATLDFDAIYQRDYTRFSNLAMVPGDHFWASFTHLNGYSSNYYTYVLDKVIALDFFAQFDPQDLLGGPAGMRYRQTVLAPGATEPATGLVRNFLGREMNLDAYRRWLLAEFAGAAPAAAATTASSSAR